MSRFASRFHFIPDADTVQPTIGRALRALDERGWVTHDQDGYRVTPIGRFVGEGFADPLAVLETEHELREVVGWLPTAELDFDLRELGDATITTPSPTRPNAPVERTLALLGGAKRVRVISHTLNEQSLKLACERVRNDELRFGAVLSESAIEALSEAGLGSELRALSSAVNATVLVSPATLPIAVTVSESWTYLFLRDEDGVLRATVDTENGTVREWAEERYERYAENARALDPDSVGAGDTSNSSSDGND